MYKAENSYKQNRTILQKQGKRQSAQIADNRHSAFQNTIKSDLIQRKVFVNGTQYIPIKIVGKEKQSFYQPQSGLEQEAINDSYNRYYKDNDEFHDHIAGKPVDCGLIKSQGKWFRLPFGNPFFVLGEQHNYISYLSIIEASNHQNSKVLGEGGVVPIDYYSESVGLLKNEKESDKNVYKMESTLSKLLVALNFAIGFNDAGRKQISDNLNNETPPTTGTRESQYDPECKVAEYIKSGVDEIGNYIFKNNDDKCDLFRDCFTLAFKLLELYNNTSKDAYIQAYNLCETCAEAEIKRTTNITDKQYKEKDPNSMREVFMFHAILMASKQGFLMAGIGNHHAENMKNKLESNRINTILLQEFMTTKYVNNAFGLKR